jgi:holo-ACP synthase/triphosphoribosyl-dephospho-CoA synthase
MEREVTLAEMLEARERRAEMQGAFLREFRCPLVSFTLNIAGPVKDTPLIRRAFRVGCQRLEYALARSSLPVRCRREGQAVTGCEALYAVEGDALAVKKLCVDIEDDVPLGRLFDLDVIGLDGQKLDRQVVQGGARNCLVCGKPGRDCASRRLHSVEELRQVTQQILTDHFALDDRRQISALATKALLDEACTTPKPGLVDRNNSGSHKDMDLFTFMASAAALTPYWDKCVELGQATAQQPPAQTFSQLRRAGLAAEREMFAATGGVNTHKGAIFSLGIVCGAIGRLWKPEDPPRAPAAILAECGNMTAATLRAELESIVAAGAEQIQTAGQRIYLRYALPGIRGEVAKGFPSVQRVSLPVFQRALASGRDRNEAGAVALVHLIARGIDTNMVSRGGLALANAAAEEAAQLLQTSPMPSLSQIARLDEHFIAQNLSPGGCADLLAVTYFLHDWQREGDAGHNF